MSLARAIKLGASGLVPSWRQGKKFAVLYKGRWIHFGAANMSDYTQHKDKARRDRYRQRHSQIFLRDGRPAYMVKESPAFWSYHLLW